jgi:uncharacterized protein
MRRFDINACFGHWQYWDLIHTTREDLVALMDRHGIDFAACLSLRGVFIDWRAGNEETLAAATMAPDRLVPMATISPFLGGDADALRMVLDAGARGVRLFPSFHNFRLDSEFVDEVCTVAAERVVPVMIQTRPMMNWRFAALSVDAIGPVVDRHPETTFILSGPNYLVEFQALVKLMDRCSNVMYEISCLQGFDGVKNLVSRVKASRVLFGTGAVLNYPACNVAKLDHAEISDSHRRVIASENALRVLALSG